MKFKNKEKKVQEIDIGPLIDMVFILLIFFAVSTTFVKDMNLELERPDASSSTVASTKAIRVYIDRGGQIFIDEQPVRLYMLQSRVRDIVGASTSKMVLVIADRQVTAQQLINVVDQCKMGGAEEVGVATEQS